MAWLRKSKVGVVGRVVKRTHKEEARLLMTLWATVSILDFIPSVMGSLWRVLTGEQCDLAYIVRRSLCYVKVI